MMKSVSLYIRMAFVGMAVVGSLLCVHEKADAAKKKVDLAGKYHAALGVETDYSESVHRYAYYEKKYVNAVDRKQLIIGESGTVGYRIMEGTFKDTSIKGNGTYEVSLTNADFNANRSFRKLYVATDIPYTKKVKFKNVSISINGRRVRTFDEAVLDQGEHNAYCVILVIDTNDSRVRNAFARSSVPRSTQNEIKISFDVDGFLYAKGEKPPTPTPVPTPTPEITEAPEPEVENEVQIETESVEKEEVQEVIQEVPFANKVGIAVTVVLAIGAIVICVVTVNQRQH